MGVQPVFGYGTLLFRKILEKLLGREVETKWATLKNYKRCKINKDGRTAKGPAIRPQRGAEVRGKLIFISDADWLILKDFETFAGGYEPSDEPVFLDDCDDPVAARTFVVDKDLQEFLHGEWSEEEFREDPGGYAYYLEVRIDAFLDDYRKRKGC